MLKILLLFLFTISSLLINAQQPYAININDVSGLPSNAVYNIYEDSKGYIWIACDEGLCRYDGVSFKVFKSSLQTSTSGSSIVEDSEGRIWYQNFDGYCYYVQNDSLIALTQNKPLGFYPIGMTNKFIFLLQPNGVDIYDVKTLKNTKTLNIPFSNARHTCATSKAFYFILENRIHVVNDNKIHSILPIILNENEIVNQLYSSGNRIFIVSKYNENKQIYELIDNNKLAIIIKDNSKLILGFTSFKNEMCVLSSEGVVYHKKGMLPQHLFNNYSISSMIMDKNHNYWIGTTNNGILLVPNIQNSFLPLSSYEPSVMLKNKTGFYVFTKKDEIIHINKSINSYKLVKRNEGKSSVYYAFIDSLNQNLFVSSQGTSIYAQGNLLKKDFNTYAIKEITRIDQKYYAYAASGSIGLIRSPSANNSIFSNWDSIFKSNMKNMNFSCLRLGLRAKSIAFNSSNQAFYYTSNLGLYKQTLYKYTEILFNKEKIYGKQIVINDNKLYVCSTKGLLYQIINDSLINVINNISSLKIADVKRIKKFGNKLCVIGSNKIVFLDVQNPNIKKGELSLKIKTTNILDIIIENEKVHILTNNGIITNVLPKNYIPPPQVNFAISQIAINENEHAIQTNYFLNYNQNNISIKFTVFDFIYNESNTLYYSLNNEAWKPISSKNRVIEFASLAPGTYKLKFKINDITSNNQNIVFVIEKPFWLRWWFVLFAIFCIAILLYLFYKWQITLLNKKNKLITEKVKLENELNKSLLTSIRSQMNPHFFYNALNTIQSYIFINDKKNASNYLAKFSKLTRMILEMSEKDLISLADEIESLLLYLDLEKMRFEDDFNFSFKIDPILEIDLIKIPPMLIQPYVENAIKHGLLHKIGTKNLDINFEKSEFDLIIKITDNGIGMKRSLELNQIKNSKHQSFSTAANKKRLELLNKNKPNTLGVYITDRINEFGLPNGTEVRLVIPLN